MFCCCEAENDNGCPQKYRVVKKRLVELGEMMDVYDMTCSICIQLFENPYTVCKNGHTLCKKCYDQSQQASAHLVAGARCPTCRMTMLNPPYPNRVADACVTWYNAMLRKILPFSRNDLVEVSYACGDTKESKWMPARVMDMDLHKMVYVLLPSAPWKTMLAMSTCLTPIYMTLEEMETRMRPKSTNLPCWRSLEWVRQHGVRPMGLYFCGDMEENPLEWIPVSIHWDFIDTTGEEHILVGYDTEFSRDVQWVSLLSENIYRCHPCDFLRAWDSIARQRLATSTTTSTPCPPRPPLLLPPAPSAMWTYQNSSFDPALHRVMRHPPPLQVPQTIVSENNHGFIVDMMDMVDITNSTNLTNSTILTNSTNRTSMSAWIEMPSLSTPLLSTHSTDEEEEEEEENEI